jgi:flavin reductase (DIM6/NTAB) family NADH-FMN oxidoreductase RutF
MNVEGDHFDVREFRRGVWHQTLTEVALLTAVADGVEGIMACEWAMLVAFSPMTFVISVAPRHATYGLIERSGEFGLSFCSDKQARLSHISGSYSLHDVDKWHMADFPRYAPAKIKAPMIDECALNVECRVVETRPFDVHTLIIGEALWAKYDPTKKPLIYHDGKYWHLGAQVPKD